MDQNNQERFESKKVKFPTKKLELPPEYEALLKEKEELEAEMRQEAGLATSPAPKPPPPKVKFPTGKLVMPGTEAEQEPEPEPEMEMEMSLLDDDDEAETSESKTVEPPYSTYYSVTKTPYTPKRRVQTKTSEPEEGDSSYMEAHQLYTPMFPQEEEPEEEVIEEEPLIADDYKPPYNIFEELVEVELNLLLSRYIDVCRCSQCRSDVVALALQQLPAYYITGQRGTETAKRIIAAKYMQRVMSAVNRSAKVVFKKPRNACKKIKQVLWIKPHLEEAEIEETLPTAQLADEILDSELELEFSDEISELIQIVEEAEQEKDDPDPDQNHPALDNIADSSNRDVTAIQTIGEQMRKSSTKLQKTVMSEMDELRSEMEKEREEIKKKKEEMKKKRGG